MDTKSNLKWNPFTEGYFSNPYPHLKNWRENAPIQQIFNDSFLFLKHEDINTVLKEKNFKVHSLSDYLGEKEEYIFKGMENPCPYLSKGTELWPMYLNDNLHKKIRKAITKSFHALPLEEIINDAIEKTHLEFNSKKSFNLVDYCGEFIFFFIINVLNIESKDYNHLKRFSNLLARSQDLYTPKQLFKELNSELIDNKNIFQNSIFKDTLLKETKELNLEENQLYSIMLVSFMAAFETSKDNLAIGLLEILKDRELINYTLNANKNRLKILIEEILRFSSPLQYTIRINTTPLTFGEIEIPPHSKLYLCIASANRDENLFDNPDSLIPNREINPHLSFGAGTHICLGAAIARKEMEICLQKMIEFIKDYDIKEVKWTKQIFMRTAESILIEKNNV